MPLYEYKCNHCHQNFEILKSAKEASGNVSCPSCGQISTRIISGFSYRRKATYLQKVKEQNEERMWKADRRMQEDKLLQPDNWLAKVKKEREEEKAFRKKVEQNFGKGPDGFRKYEAATAANIQANRNDAWASD